VILKDRKSQLSFHFHPIFFSENGYGPQDRRDRPHLLDVFSKFYGLAHFPAAAETEDAFNALVYLKRIETSIEAFLIEANSRFATRGCLHERLFNRKTAARVCKN
jgi:hypothetical protein